ncbi:MAG: hypothetical protein GY847_17925 [Proteobacteria bacterium]|nr:hypothetical protein [Pseudomonadota bacterium]
MPYNIWRIRGKVVAEGTESGIGGLSVEHWDKDYVVWGRPSSDQDDRLGSVTTESDGSFYFEFDDDAFRDTFLEYGPALYFKIFQAGELVKDTSDNVKNLAPYGQEINITLEVDLEVPSIPEGACSVLGIVANLDGNPLEGYVAKAFHKLIGNDIELGDATTNEDGFYKIDYNISQLGDPDKEHPDLVVKIYDAGDLQTPLISSGVYVSAPLSVAANLVIDTGPPEEITSHFDDVASKVETEVAGVSLDSLEDDDFAVIADKVGTVQTRVRNYVHAKRLDNQTQGSSALTPKLFFALLEKELPLDLASMLRKDRRFIVSAIESATDDKIVDASLADDIDTITDQFDNEKVQAILADGQGPEDRTLFRNLLDYSTLDASDYSAFAKGYLNNEEDLESFWDTIKNQFDVSKVDNVKLFFDVSNITDKHLPLAQTLCNRGDIEKPIDLTGLSLSDWSSLCNDPAVGVPDKYDAEGFIDVMKERLELLFPSKYITCRMKEENYFGSGLLGQFLEQNPLFDIYLDNLDTYLQEYSNALDGIGDQNECKSLVKALNRICWMVPKKNMYSAVKAMWQNNLHSAHCIARRGRASFLSQFSEVLGGESIAKEIFIKARRIASATIALFAKYAPGLNSIDTHVLPSNYQTAASPDDLPTLKTLFGSMDMCECKHCRSVLSPSAYLVDLMEFMEDADSFENDGQEENPIILNEMLRRRPDIQKVWLNCQNTNTPMPYIDLVNEILEAAVVNDTSDVAHQSTLSAEELRAEPEYINVEAYDGAGYIHDALYPWSFNLWQEEAKVYLDYLGVEHHRLMEILADSSTDPSNEKTPENIANLYLGITSAEKDNLPKSNVDLITYYGPGVTPTNLQEVSKLLEYAQLSYEELIELLQSTYVNPAGLGLVFTPDSSCSIDNANINLAEDSFRKLYKLRLFMRKTGWSVTETDRCLNASGLGADAGIPLNSIIDIANVHRLHRLYPRLELADLLCWFHDMDTEDYFIDGKDDLSLYTRRFINPTEVVEGQTTNNDNNNTELSEIFKLDLPIGERVKILNPAVLPLVSAGVGLSQAEVASIIEIESIIDPSTDFDLVNLENLSLLYRISIFCKALKISVDELYLLKKLLQQDPFDTTNDCRDFIAKWEVIKDAGFDPETLDYIVYHASNDKTPKSEEEEAFFSSIVEGLSNIEATINEQVGEDVSETLANLLALKFTGEKLVTMLTYFSAYLSNENGDKIPEYHFSDSGFESLKDDFEKYMLSSEVTAMDGEALIADRISAALAPLRTHIEETQKHDVVCSALSEELDLDIDVIVELMDTYLKHPDGSDPPAIRYFLALDLSSVDLEDPLFKKLHAQIHKISLVFNTLEIPADEDELAGLFHTAKNWVDLAVLATKIPTTTPSFDSWLALFDVYNAKKLLGKIEGFSVFKLLLKQYGNADATKLLLAEKLGWSKSDLDELNGKIEGFTLTPPYEVTPAGLLLVIEAFEAIEKTGATATEMVGWAVLNSLSSDVSRQIKNAAKYRYDINVWYQNAPDIRDALREKQRDILQGYLIGQERAGDGRFKDEEDLYSYFLMDTNMSACFLTSRIKRAISSVQLMIQRVFLNLEKDVGGNLLSFSKDAEREWKWRRNYRVWEANRKVFLFPENWIEPELRDDKSSFFKELENELLQDELNLESAERAYLSYLKKLEEVSNLEIAAVLDETTGDDTVIIGNEYGHEVVAVHVFARTKGIPHTYYHRKFVIQSRYWTPWEKIDLDIEGDHLIPVFFNRRLFLFWPKFADKVFEPQATDMEKDDPQDPPKYWEVRFSWSRLYNGKWDAPKTTTDSFAYAKALGDKIDFLPLPFPNMFGIFGLGKEQLYFRAHVENGVLRISTFLQPKLTQIRGLGIIPLSIELAGFAINNCSGELEKRWSADTLPQLMKIGFNLPPLLSYTMNQKFTTYLLSYLVFLETTANPLVSLMMKDGPIALWTKLIFEHTGGYIPLGKSLFVDLDFQAHRPFFFQDEKRSFFVFAFDKEYFMQNLLTEWQQPNTENPVDVSLIPNRLDLGLLSSKLMPSPSAQTPENTSSNTMQIVPEEFWQIATDPTKAIEAAEENDIETKFNLMPKRYYFQKFYHPYICLFIKQINRHGIEGLLNPDPNSDEWEAEVLVRQRMHNHFFDDVYHPNPDRTFPTNAPMDDIEFTPSGAYSSYNWELFFHAPMLVACRLMQDQKFEEAQQWFHYIFNPTETQGGDPFHSRFWKLKPFYYHTSAKTVSDLLNLLANPDPDNPEREDVLTQIDVWQDDPFDPHAIARLRIVAYMWNTIMKYLDNLIAWGDQLFMRASIESITEATQIYTLAEEILGKRPVFVKKDDSTETDYGQIRTELDEFSNIPNTNIPALQQLVEIETSVAGLVPEGNGATANLHAAAAINNLFYFCIPHNEKLLGYWDTVADRLYKIRHCLDINGVPLRLALFEPPIDPGMLVKAAAAGIDIGAAISDLHAPLPCYRYRVLYQKAVELCNDVKSLGGALLSALEKKDAEALAVLRAGHEIELNNAIKALKERAIEEAKENIAALDETKKMVKIRHDFYRDIERINRNEQSHMDYLVKSFITSEIAQGISIGVSVAHSVPNFDAGIGGWAATPLVKVSFGGSNLGSALQSAVTVQNMIAAYLSHKAQMASIKGGYDRRWDDWKLQESLADQELEQIAKQRTAAEIRLDMAEKDLENQKLQIENSLEAKAYLEDKYTNEELYNWMVTQVSSIYFQSYKLALNLAKKAERAFQNELFDTDTNFIQFGYWDSLKKGLFAGELLVQDLRRMDIAYLDRNKREFELTKNISMAQVNPGALLDLITTGTCSFDTPEYIFDLDHPGHYQRRIKSAKLTIPCVAGPNTTVGAMLTLESSKIRKSTDAEYDYSEDYKEEVFVYKFGASESIATSSAQSDSGLFELNFNDERYLPFEGAGVIGKWQLTLPEEYRQFDYSTISDVILTIQYTAKPGIAINKVNTALQGVLDPTEGTWLTRVFSLKHEFADKLHELKALKDKPDPETGKYHAVDIKLAGEHFPHLSKYDSPVVKPMEVEAAGITAHVKWADKESLEIIPTDSDWSYLISELEMNITQNTTDDLSDVEDIVLLVEYKLTEKA